MPHPAPEALPHARAGSRRQPVERFSSTRSYRPLRPPETVEDKDACGIYASVNKGARATHDAIPVALTALEKMLHRAGNIDGEGDGCGVLMDIPRKIWAEEIRAGGHASRLALGERFAVVHVMMPRKGGRVAEVQEQARALMSKAGLRVLAEREGVVDSTALGPGAREEEPVFWQVGGLIEDPKLCFELALQMEDRFDVHVASCSTATVIYKVLGAPAVLGLYYPDLRDPRAETVSVLGHNRYSTNTWTSFRRAQPFGVLGHNGEINTIARLRQEAKMLGVPLHADGSDSQDLSRTVEALIYRQGLTLLEALEMALPPIVDEIKGMPPELRGFYMYLRQAFGPFAQGPVALVSRFADEHLFSVDALGLRPLWQLETGETFVFSSEPGVVAVADTVSEPKPLAPGEKVLVSVDRSRSHTRLHDHGEMQRLCARRWLARVGGDGDEAGYAGAMITGGPLSGFEIPGYTSAGPSEPVKVSDRVLGGFGWQREDMKLVQQMAATGAEPIGSLGYDGPLACLSPERQNLADFFKESVAVVTNPAIDREREVEHFSCRAVLGARPSLHELSAEPGTVEIAFPVLFGGHDGLAPLSDETYRAIAHQHKTYLLEDIWEAFRGHSAVLDISCLESEDTRGAIERLKQEATTAVRGGAELVVLSDRTAYEGDRRYLDPHLALAAVDLALREHYRAAGETNLRRRCGVVLRSAAIRNVHDTVLALGLGADAVCPYAMVEVSLVDDYRTDVDNLASALRKGIEKVISTIGIHEVRGYARLFSSIGLRPELTTIFDTPAYMGSKTGGTGFAELDTDADERQRVLRSETESKPAKTFRFYPKVYKAAIAAANGSASFAEYSEKVRALEAEQPISLRHIVDVQGDRDPIPSERSDPGVGLHSYPIVISSMSFGSQGETAYRAYAEAAKRINIIAMNGEGGEIQDMYGKYPLWRGQQVASGRFGVTNEMVNSSYLVEIKIGQGAKPGEGGHLPGRKVTAKVAQARNATIGTDLISPSNNHDLYSIEDLAELIDELKTANPDVRVSVKVPVVPNIGTIGVGIAKAGADMITLSGYEGGTGAARSHALRHVGLPSDIGTRAVHLALMEAGIRNRVEIWADGGYRHATDIVKLHCLGANRVGFGTLAMVSIGCTICRGCQLDTCHVGIATQIEDKEEADLKGLKKFTPQEFERASESSARFFSGMGEELREIVASLGYERAQDLVGRSDLLVQARAKDRVDVEGLIKPLEEMLDLEPLDLPAPADEREAAGLICARPIRMKTKEASGELAALSVQIAGGHVVHRDSERAADADDRVLGTSLAGEIARSRILGTGPEASEDTLADLRFDGGSVAGQGLGAFNVYGVDITVEGGAQDGVAKTMLGGKVSILKGANRAGRRVNGSVGKSFAYGAQRGRLFVQGDADSRFCIRLSGADVVIAGEPAQPLDDSRGCLADRANIKGFAFEYMTNGRAVVMGDPGPWMCAGQTGGRVYLRVNDEWNLDRAALERRRGEGAKVEIRALDAEGVLDVQELLGHYCEELRGTGQDDEADRVAALAGAAEQNFLMSIPEGQQTDPSVST
ncbi:MAG: glutamate synthase-related protein, partial [Actinomycetota bacterium]|nr:glutamate synthase-related protein [Actinomycetota bacterium]